MTAIRRNSQESFRKNGRTPETGKRAFGRSWRIDAALIGEAVTAVKGVQIGLPRPPTKLPATEPSRTSAAFYRTFTSGSTDMPGR